MITRSGHYLPSTPSIYRLLIEPTPMLLSEPMWQPLLKLNNGVELEHVNLCKIISHKAKDLLYKNIETLKVLTVNYP